MRRLSSILLVLGLLLFGNQTFAQGCSQCKMLAEQGSELSENSFGSDLNSGILYIMLIPYLIFMVVMFMYRKQIGTFFKSLVKAK
ncbi:MAG: hypothetical protein V4638_00405 [Bacteroidota bacterium]